METIKTILLLEESFGKLPGIGPKTAERLSYATLRLSEDERKRFIEALEDSMTKVKRCPECGFYFEDECPICSDKTRDRKTILVVSDSKDVLSIEKTKSYNGLYFCLDALLSPLKNKTPETTGVLRLKEKVLKEGIQEVILALPTDLEGETTRLYISSLFKGTNVQVSRIAYGIPVGTNLEYLDNMTISQSIQFRIPLKNGGKDNV